MVRDEYAFVPAKEFDKLEHEIEHIKDNPVIHKGAEGKQLVKSMDNLQGALSNLMNLFERAHEDLTLEQRETKILQEQLTPVYEKLDYVSEQNETLANGVVTIADSILELKDSIEHLKKSVAAIASSSQEIHKSHLNSPFSVTFERESGLNNAPQNRSTQQQIYPPPNQQSQSQFQQTPPGIPNPPNSFSKQADEPPKPEQSQQPPLPPNALGNGEEKPKKKLFF